MRRFLCFAFVGFMVAAPTSAQTAGQVQEQLLVSVERANVRDMPSLSGEVVFQVSKGQLLRVIQKEGNWYWMEAPGGRRGFISATVVQVVPSQKPVAPASAGSASTTAVQSRSQSSAKGNADVIAMAKAGLSDTVVLAAIEKIDSAEFDLSPSGLIALKDGGVSEAVIRALVSRGVSPVNEDSSAVPPEPRSVQPQAKPSALSGDNVLVGSTTDLADWTRQLNEARRRRSRGIRFFIAGAGTAVAAPLIVVNLGTARMASLMSVGGAGLAIYGIYNWYTASERIDDLDREGRIKGYLTYVPLPKGGAVYATLTF